VCGGCLFLFLSISFFMEPVQVLTGVVTVMNQTTVNVTITNSTATYSSYPTAFNSVFALIFFCTGFYLVFYGIYSVKRD